MTTIYYAEGSASYHVDRTCYTIRGNRTFRRDVYRSAVGGPITNPQGRSAADKLAPCRVCVEGYKPQGGGLPGIAFGGGR